MRIRRLVSLVLLFFVTYNLQAMQGSGDRQAVFVSFKVFTRLSDTELAMSGKSRGIDSFKKTEWEKVVFLRVTNQKVVDVEEFTEIGKINDRDSICWSKFYARISKSL
jgi:hypothetical protein